MGHDEMHPRVLRELTDAVAKPLSLFSNVMAFRLSPKYLEKGKTLCPRLQRLEKENLEDNQPVTLTSVPVKVMEQILLDLLRHLENRKVIQDSQRGFTKDKSCLTNLVASCAEWPYYKGKAMDVICLDLHKVFDMSPHNSFLSKLKRYGFNGSIGQLSSQMTSTLHRTLLSWTWPNTSLSVGSSEWILYIVLLACTAFALSIQLSSSQPMSFLIFLIPLLIPPQGKWGSNRVGLSCHWG